MATWADGIRAQLHIALDQIEPRPGGLDRIIAKIVTTKPCPLCDGTGTAAVFIGHWRCRLCGGSGRIPR